MGGAGVPAAMTFAVTQLASGVVTSSDVLTGNMSLNPYDLVLIFKAGQAPPNFNLNNSYTGDTPFVQMLADWYSDTLYPQSHMYVFRAMPYKASTWNLNMQAPDAFSQPYLFNIIKVSGVLQNGSGYAGGSLATGASNYERVPANTSLSVSTTSIADSIAIAACSHALTEDITIGSGFTNFTSQKYAAPPMSLRVGYKLNASSASASWPTATQAIGGILVLRPFIERPNPEISIL